MTANEDFSVEGGCTCGRIRYRLNARPMFVHCCHCRWCQRETGSAFVLNALVEADKVTLLSGPPEAVATPTESGKGQTIHRCPDCHVALWSNYSGAGDKMNFLRVGALDNPDLIRPDIHIFTSSKQPWVVLDPATPATPEYYNAKEYWPEESQARWRALTG